MTDSLEGERTFLEETGLIELTDDQIASSDHFESNHGFGKITTEKEIKAWCMFEFASYPVSSLSITLLFPILIETLIEGLIAKNTPISFMGIKVESAISYTSYVGSTSVILQALAFIFLGSLADYGGLRKKLLFLSSYMAIVLCFAIFFVKDSDNYGFAAFLQIFINLFYGISQVFFNAFLPLLVKNHPEYVSLKRSMDNPPDYDVSLLKQADMLGNSISGKSFMFGYGATVLALVSSAILFNLWPGSLEPVKLCIVASGIWWLIFSVYTFKHLTSRPGPTLPDNEKYYLISIKKLYQTFKHYKRIPNTFFYLISYLMFSDGHSTINMVSILYAKVNIGMVASELVLLAILASIFGLVGNIFFLHFQRKMGYSSKQMNILLLILLSLIPIYSLMGLVSDTLGIRTKLEMYIIGSYYGFLIGAVQSFSKVLFSELIPPGDEAEFFSLYEITDKGSSWFGPLMVGLINDATHDIRYGFLVLLVLLILPAPLLLKTNVQQGKRDALAFSAWKRRQQNESDSRE